MNMAVSLSPSLPHSPSAQRCGGTRRVRSSSSSCHPSLLYTTLGTIPTERSIAFFSFLLLSLSRTHMDSAGQKAPSPLLLRFALLPPFAYKSICSALAAAVVPAARPIALMNNKQHYITTTCAIHHSAMSF